MPKGTISAEQGSDNIALAVGAILVTVFALSLGDALIKQVSAGFVLWQIFVVRSLLAVPVLLLVILVFAKNASLIPIQLGWTSVRSLMLVFMWIAYYVSLPHLQLSVAAAAYYTLPLFITLFSAVFVGERISKLGWLAVGIGFLGVLLILRPKAEEFNAYALLPLVSAMLYALAMILTRTKCQTEHPLTLSLVLNIYFVLTGVIAAVMISVFVGPDRNGFLLAPWTPMEAEQWTAMCLLAAAILIGSIGAAIAYQKGPSSMVGTFDFAYVGFAVLWGLVFFAEVPDIVSIAGMSMIVAAGVLSIRYRTGS
jgi:drug/metabolite transporter (DMT)-like permease